MKVTLQGVCSAANLAAGSALVLAVIFGVAIGTESAKDVWVYALLGVLCLAVGGFLLVPLPGAVTLLSVPVAVFTAIVAMLLTLGNWVWGASQAHAVNAVLAGAVVLMLLEVVSVVAAWRAKVPGGRRRVGGPSPAITPPDAAPQQEIS